MSILGGIAARAREARLEDLADPLTLALARELRRLIPARPRGPVHVATLRRSPAHH
jgi:hypothetical protein